jgi:hypothetical protein
LDHDARRLQIFGPDTPDSLPGVFGHIPSLSGYQGFQSSCFFPAASRLILIPQSYVLAMGREYVSAPIGQRRQKRRHNPQLQVQEESPPSPPREPRPNRRPGKEPTSSSQAPSRASRQAPYIMPSMAMPPPFRANPTRKGISWEICPRTPPCLKIDFKKINANILDARSSPVLKLCPVLRLRWGEITSNKPWH